MNAAENIPAPDTAVAPRARTTARKVLRWTEHLLAAIGLCFVVYHFGFEMTAMTSDSMAPTLQGTSYENGDRILLEKVTGSASVAQTLGNLFLLQRR